MYDPQSRFIYIMIMNNLNLYPSVLCGQVLKILIKR